MLQQLIEAITDMREGDALKITADMLARGTNPLEVLDGCRQALEVVGQRYEQGVYYLPELLMAGEMLNQITEIVKPKLAALPQVKRHGKVLIGTVAGDIHDIGKDIVTFMLDVNGFEVLDLGVDIPPQKFIEAIRDFQPQVVGLSGFLTLAYDAMQTTVAAIEQAGLRKNLKIMIGGGSMDDQIRQHTGADAYGRDAMAAVKLAKDWIGGH